MQRRELFRFIAGLVATWPLALRAQKSPIVIGFLAGQAPPPSQPNDAQYNALMQGFRDNGLTLGQDFLFEPRFAGGDDDRFPELARELVQLNARIILANTPAGARAAQRLNPPVPVLITLMNDPVGAGLITSLAHPGNHTTGTASLNEDVTPKLLEFLREIVPHATSLAVLFNPLNPTNPVILENLRAKAQLAGITLFPHSLKPRDDLDSLFLALAAQRPDALQVIGDPAIGDLRGHLAARALVLGLPIFSTSSIVAEAGGLISYGAPVNRMLSRMGYYVKRILDGAKPDDLPVEQPTEVALIINLRTAKALGIEISPTLLARADQVIE
jgi:putative tryptophan/tyrosine transport system substrate-binding protein